VAAVFCVVIPRPAGAQTSDDVARARELFVQASEQRDGGDVRGALEKFKAAHSIVANPITTFELARTFALLGQLVEARSAYLSILALPIQPAETDRATLARREAARAADEVRSRMPTISVKVAAPPSHVTISFDGEAAAPALLVAPRAVNPGTHRLVAIGADGKRVEQEVDLREGESREVEVAVPLASPGPPPHDPTPASAPPPPPVQPSPATSLAPAPAASGNHFGPFAYLGFGLGIAGFATGTVFAASALSKASTASQCNQMSCSQAAIDALQTTEQLAVGAVVSYVVAGFGVLVGLTDLVFYRSDPHEQSSKLSVHPWIGAGTAGLYGSF
jgi:hypothetical protein